jgi:hypothetical protein
MTQNEATIDRIREYLRQLTRQARGHLLTEIERLRLCGDDIPGAEIILAELRSEFRKDGQAHDRVGVPRRQFFLPLEPFLVDRSPEHANAGQIARGSLAAIWGWISSDLMPNMAHDYAEKMKQVLAANNQREAKQHASAFQSKAVKYLDGTLASRDGAEHIRAGLAKYTSAPESFNDIMKMLCVLRTRDALVELNETLPGRLDKFEDEQLHRVRGLLNSFTARHADAAPFALALVAKRLETPWQLIRLATKAAGTKDAADVAATPYAFTVSMVLDQLDDKRLALREALQDKHIPMARDILTEMYDIEYALQVRLDSLNESDWGLRLRDVMEAVTDLLATEMRNLPAHLHHVLGSRTLHSHASLTGRLTYVAWKGRDALTSGAAYCKGLVGLDRKSNG